MKLWPRSDRADRSHDVTHGEDARGTTTTEANDLCGLLAFLVLCAILFFFARKPLEEQ